MIESMTGFGKGVFADNKRKITVEIKSINSKQLDLIIRMPSIFREKETEIRNIVAPLLERGKVDMSISVENLSVESGLSFNKDLIKTYKDNIEELCDYLDVPVPSDWIPLLFRMPDVMTTKTQEAGDEETEGLFKACKEAADNIRESRLKEGLKLYDFFIEKITAIRHFLSEIDAFESDRVPKIRERLEQQLQKLESIEYDKNRLEQELIYYIEKLDVTEEKQRLRSHLTYFEETLGEPEEISTTGAGKKLGFISQEIGREINTLGSKSNDAEMQKLVVMMKDELEQIKEQVLNVL